MPENRLVKLAVRVQLEQGLPGNMLMDVPEDCTYEELVKLARDREVWF